MSSSKIIVVNQFTFCFEHGNELCFACNRDYRSTNNSNSRLRQRLSEKLGHTFEVVYGFDLEVRIFRFYHSLPSWSPRIRVMPRPLEGRLRKCFDWVRLVGSEVTEDNFDGVRARTVRNDYCKSTAMIVELAFGCSCRISQWLYEIPSLVLLEVRGNMIVAVTSVQLFDRVL